MSCSDDQIPDPNSALFSDDAFSPMIMVQLVASLNNSSQQIVKQMEKMEDTLKVMAENEKTRLVNEANMINHIKRLDTKDSNIEEIAKKALNKVDILENKLNTTCDITKVSLLDEVDKRIDKSEKTLTDKIKIGWKAITIGSIITIALIAIIYGFMISDISENEKKNWKTYQNLELHKQNHPKG